jgi:hypothetical protein
MLTTEECLLSFVVDPVLVGGGGGGHGSPNPAVVAVVLLIAGSIF